MTPKTEQELKREIARLESVVGRVKKIIDGDDPSLLCEDEDRIKVEGVSHVLSNEAQVIAVVEGYITPTGLTNLRGLDGTPFTIRSMKFDDDDTPVTVFAIERGE